MKWILVFLAMNFGADEVDMMEVGLFESMNECFSEREILVEQIGRPIINYQLICLAVDEEQRKFN